MHACILEEHPVALSDVSMMFGLHKEPLAGSLRQGGALQTAMPVTMLPAVPAAELPFPGRHFAIFIIFSWNYELFRTSLDTYLAACWGKRVIILDNSMDRIILNDPGGCYNRFLVEFWPVITSWSPWISSAHDLH